MQNFSFDTKLNKVDFEFDESQFKNEAEIVKAKVYIINKVNAIYCIILFCYVHLNPDIMCQQILVIL